MKLSLSARGMRGIVVSACYCVILFVLIRLAVDVPLNDSYLSHSAGFIIIEVVSVMIFGYASLCLMGVWRRFADRRRLSGVLEYFVIVSASILLTVGVICMSHKAEGKSVVGSHIVVPSIIVVLMSLLQYVRSKEVDAERNYQAALLSNDRIRNEQLAVEMQLLRAQYHPHFLFNMLNTVYFLIYETNDRARQAVENLSNLLRAQLYSPDEGPVSVARELDLVRSYVDLSRLRLGDRLDISVSLAPGLRGYRIHPYLLLPLVENAFKYVGGDYKICISGKIEEGRMKFSVSNSIREREGWQSSARVAGNYSGIGLRNLRRRLSILYGEDGYEMKETEDGAVHTVELSIDVWRDE